MSVTTSLAEAPFDSRRAKLAKYFNDVLSERQTLKTLREGERFIEAVCTQTDRPACLSRLTSNPIGLQSVQACMRFSISPAFLNGAGTELLGYFQDPALKAIGGGEFLCQIVTCIVEPPIFWNAFLQAYKDNILELPAEQVFGWLLLSLLELLSPISALFRDYCDIAQEPAIQSRLLNSSEFEIRTIGQKIKHIVSTLNSSNTSDCDYNPGGRHDNDFANFREIAILPTADELMSKEDAFLRLASSLDLPEAETNRLAMHLDNQFRLLREEMIKELRDELQNVLIKTKGRHKGIIVEGFTIVGMHCRDDKRHVPWGLQLQCTSDLPQLFSKKLTPTQRKAQVVKNRDILKHQSLACLILDGTIAAFAKIHRDESLLAKPLPVIVLQFTGQASAAKALLKLKVAKIIRVVQVDSATFAFEPVLRTLQGIKSLPLQEELLFWSDASSMNQPSTMPTTVIDKIKANSGQDLRHLLQTQKSINLNQSQSKSLLMGLTQRVSLIQGPPGTGKSFLGALIAKIIHDFTKETILVVCYTNHALDQFLEDLLDIGIPAESMVRLGGKSTPRTKPLSLYDQPRTKAVSRDQGKAIHGLKVTAEHLESCLEAAFRRYVSTTGSKRQLMEYLEFDDSSFFDAFQLPDSEEFAESSFSDASQPPDSGVTTQVGRYGKSVSQHYLLDQWISGKDAGIFKDRVLPGSRNIWQISPLARRTLIDNWKLEMMKDHVSQLCTIAKDYSDCQEKLDRIFGSRNGNVLLEKRIIACTTTAAAKYVQDVQNASPKVLLVEEAGEILESHILTALGRKTEQLILIGDHQQLRPKVSNHRLSVEKGDGYDLNRSLFERLIRKGYPHQTLLEQHRMRPEISTLVRHLTYPDLLDSPSTSNRPRIRGVLSDLIFVNHTHLEDENVKLKASDNPSGSSKQNVHEAKMVLKCVKYLGQNGYGTDKIVVLTPYLAQLQLLREILSSENDPVLNDLDSYDLVKAGLMPAATAKLSKNPIRISTIDNYQGEESEIVLATMTRSNASHDIGWMASPERLNVLLSRARDGLIIIGNAETFLNARKGKDIWIRFLGLLKDSGNIYDGLPMKCERHPNRTALLKTPVDFEEECPDGGCREPCNTMLNCGIHSCPQQCHQLYDHSKMACEHLVTSKCDVGHVQRWMCSKTAPVNCATCHSVAKQEAKKKKREFELQQQRELERQEHAREMAALDDSIDLERQRLRDNQTRRERGHALELKKKDLAEASKLAKNTTPIPPDPTQRLPNNDLKAIADNTNPKTAEGIPFSTPSHNESRHSPGSTEQALRSHGSSVSEKEWQRQKDVENESNDAIDSIMEMIGLEDVKAQVLKIKAKIEIALRQGTDLKDERLGVVLLGNPGTGKTTIARLYAKFLVSMGVLPGTAFIETTGSRIANDGVAGTKKHIEEIHNAGGGTLFLDEAYQLTEQQNYGGGQVLDFLLAEIENNVGKIVVILAGYNKQMEKFFEHNPGLPSRIPYSLQFEDYTDTELHQMLRLKVEKKYAKKMQVEGGMDGLYMRIVATRLGRGRGRHGFGNARALQNVFSKISERQGERLARKRRDGATADDFFLSKEDLIGPDPSKAIVKSASWDKLKKLIGLETVKASVGNMIDLIATNYQRELQEKSLIQVSLNRVFLGSPGTGKTSVAKLYGQILADVGLLSNGEVVTKSPADFIGSALGQSENQTKAILATTVGKVLIIDEAYMLYSGSGGTGNQSDIYKTAVIDTIVAEVQSVPGEDRCVLLLGYKEEIEVMFQNVNPGLSRRFAIDDAFYFQDFTSSQLRQILDLKLQIQELGASDKAKTVAIEVLERARRRPNFGNAGEVENLLSKAKGRCQTRQSLLPFSERSIDVVFEPQDFDRDWNRGENASLNCRELFKDVVGCEDIVAKLEGYQKIAHTIKALDLDDRDQVPTNFIFKGPPGTGKTTTARKMGQIFYDMGFLAVAEVIECSATDLIGQYVGQTGPKTQKVLEKALGKVLFVDEAYRLGEGHFASEAVNELVDQITKPKFKGKLIVILAGYDEDMNRLLGINAGLSSRFPEEVIFENMSPECCVELLDRELRKKNITVPELQKAGSPLFDQMSDLLWQLSALPSWGNARDVQTLAKSMIGFVYKKRVGESLKAPLELTSEEALDCAKEMLAAKKARSTSVIHSKPPVQSQNEESQFLDNTPAVPTNIATTTQKAKALPPSAAKLEKDTRNPAPPVHHCRDPGVLDSDWAQLELDRLASEKASTHQASTIKAHQKTLHESRALADQTSQLARKLAETKARDEAHAQELKRQREEARLREQRALRARDEALRLLKAEQQRQQRERSVQVKLREMGVCCAGFQWIKQARGYRCAGGSHFVSNGQLGL